MIHRTEQEIMQSWKKDIDTPLVSICIITYNHEKYIAEALDSFLMQETDFPFEIVIDEDCSLDGTAKVIRKYMEKFPNIIKANLRKKNVGAITNDIENMQRAKGKYLAFCEGDDCWTDKRKLQYQIEKMKEYNKCKMSFHPAKLINDQTMSDTVLSRHAEDNKIFDIKEIIKGNGQFCPTASLIIKKDVIDNLPSFYENVPVGDYFLQIFGSINGGALYIDKTMSAYRIHPGGVWTSMESDFSSRKKFAFKFIHSLEQMDGFFNYQYKDEIAFIKSQTFSVILGKKNFSIHNRIDLYKTNKHHLSNDHQIQWSDNLAKKIEEQQVIINNLKKTEKQQQVLMDLIREVTKLSLVKHPIKKYKAYKSMLKDYFKIRKAQK